MNLSKIDITPPRLILYLFAVACAFSLSATTLLISAIFFYYILNIKKNFLSSPKDFIYFIVFYTWRGITDILNGFYSSFFTAFGDIWDKIPYVTASQFKFDKKTIENFLKVLLWTNIVIVIYALLQKYAGFPIVVKKLFTDDWLRFKGYHSHPLRFAGYLSTVSVIAFSFGIYYRKSFICLAILVFIGLILNGSRTYWFSVVLTVGVISFLKSWRSVLFILLTAAIIGAISYYLFPEVSMRIRSSYDSNYRINNLSDIELRKNFWKAGIEISTKKPVYGIGAKKVGKYLKPYEEKGLIDNTAHCHNVYITYLAESGIIGIGLLIFLMFYFLRKYFVIYRNSTDDFIKAIAISAFACWLNVAISGFFENNFSTLVLWGIMSFWIGVVESYLYNHKEA